MDIRQIESNLASLFSPSDSLKPRQLVFWYDPKEDFGEDFAELTLPDGVEKLTLGDTPFTVKYKLLVEAPTSSFLLYAPFAEPPPQGNWLLDLQKQGELFSADQAALLFRQYGFHERSLQNYLREHLSFFKAKKRRDALSALSLPKEASEMDLRIGLLSVLAGLKVADAEALIRTVLKQGLNEEKNALWQELTKYVAAEEFWLVVQHRLGVPADTTTLRDLFIRLALTHLQHDLDVPLPEGLKSKLIQPSTRAYVFVSSWLRNSSDRQSWEELSRQLAPDLGIREFAGSRHPSGYSKAETFEAFDQALIHTAIENLTAGTIEPNLKEWLSARKPLFWFGDYRQHYRALEAATELLELLTQFAGSYSGTAETLFKRYAETLHQIDGAYRRYVAASDSVTEDDFAPLTEALERRYTYEYLEPIGEAWSEALQEKNGVWGTSGKKQWWFYNQQVMPVVERSDREKVYVIVSDALRFEVAAELKERLVHDLRGEAQLSPVLSVLPSITKLGMAALLPSAHDALNVGDKGEVLISGRSTQGLEARSTVLNSTGVSSLAVKASELLTMSREEGRQAVQPHRVIYIYQDHIDAVGDHTASEREVFSACERAIDEIELLVKRVANQLNGTNVIITSDHGFLYQRQTLEQYDKVARAGGEVLDSGRRHALGRNLSRQEGAQTFSLPYFKDQELQAQSPRGTLRYAVQGGGAQYVHGGASLQEVCVPVLNYKHVRAEKGDDGASHKVGVRVSTTARRVTNTHFTVRLVQDEPVGGRVRARQVLVKLVTEDGRAVTNAYPLNLDSAAKQATDREYIARLTVGAGETSRTGTAYLVVVDAEDDLQILREAWQVNLAFTDDFGDF
jgi:uncharacterized protein (TIGR02687 family)